MNDKQNTLEDLVPPLELCEQAAEVIGDKTALVWEVYRCQYGVDPYVMSRETSETTRGSAVESVYPAPTLAELLEMLPDGTMAMMDAPGVWVVIRGGGTQDIKLEKCDSPATAALRLLMRVKGVDV